MTSWSGLADLVEKVLHGAQGLSIGQGNTCASHSKFARSQTPLSNVVQCSVLCTLLDNSCAEVWQSFFLGPSRKCSCNTLCHTNLVKQRGSATLTRLARLQYGLPRSRLKDCSIALDSYRSPHRRHCPRHRCSTHGSSPDIRTRLMYEINNIFWPAITTKWVSRSRKIRFLQTLQGGPLLQQGDG